VTERDQEEQDLRIALLELQMTKTEYDINRVRQEMRWEPYKAIAAILVGIVAAAGLILGVAHIIH
jgi:hypothetical protein